MRGLKAGWAIVWLLVSAPSPALADPTGTFDVAGTNPDSGDTYSGTVEVSRTGETYAVVWTIAGAESTGVGLGGNRGGKRDGKAGSRPASSGDDMLAVGYGNDDGFGVAHYDLQPDGSWKGVWAYGEGTRVATEIWTRTRAGETPQPPAKPKGTATKPMRSPPAKP